ncbi:MAG: hypothetical protein N4A70_14360 [Pelagimonas sp.]|jgi:hypothetical protein|nr:hypothetical protein [Pelagimonas sp.]
MGRGLLLCFALFCLGLISGCSKSELFSWRQTLTVVVNTPTGTKSGSADQLVRARFYLRSPLATTTEVEHQVLGDPLILDLGAGKILFAVQTRYLVERVFGDNLNRYEIYKAFVGDPPLQPRVIDFSNRSITENLHLFHFENPSDPSTIVRVDPSDFAASFGPGFTLQEARMSVAGFEPPDWPKKIGGFFKPLTGQILTVLPWLNTHSEALTLERHGRSDLRLSPLDLIRGVIR